MTSINYSQAERLLEDTFRECEEQFIAGSSPSIDEHLAKSYDVLFASATQAYREVLLGCIIVRLLDASANVRQPYVKLGNRAYSGRALDENVINPFLRRKKVPCSKGPFLSVFRRSVRFDESTRTGLRDKAGYDGFLSIIEVIEKASSTTLVEILRYHLHRFIQLRESSHIEIQRVKRISLIQCEYLIGELLRMPSGGRFPVFLILSTFQAIKEVYRLDWEIDFHGINVADKAARASGDVTIRSKGNIFLVAEITERIVDRERVIATFETKIAPKSIEDYLFLVLEKSQDPAVLEQAKKYFAQGHEVNFLEIKSWIVSMLSILGFHGRFIFLNSLANYLDNVDIPKALKVAWNDTMQRIAAGRA
jgi:hypothetical protein